MNIVDDYTRECLAIEVDTSLGGVRVVRVLEELKQRRVAPLAEIETYKKRMGVEIPLGISVRDRLQL